MFEYVKTVGFRDADAGGVVFFARYFMLAHEAYEAFLLDRGIDIAKLLLGGGYVLPVVHAESEYRRALALGEQVTIRVTVEEVRRRAFTVGYELVNAAGELSARLHTRHVAIDGETRRAMPLPEDLAKALRE